MHRAQVHAEDAPALSLGDELEEGAWWVFAGTPDDLFSADPREMWRHVLRRQPPPLSLVSTYPQDVSLN